MKKYISKTMIGLSTLFAGIIIYIVVSVLTKEIFFHEFEKFALVGSIALSGLFLGLYRIIDLLETHYKK